MTTPATSDRCIIIQTNTSFMASRLREEREREVRRRHTATLVQLCIYCIDFLCGQYSVQILGD